MPRLVALLLLASFMLLAGGAGCTTVRRSTPDQHADYPHDGILLQYSRDGRLIMKAVMRHDKFVDVWEYERREDLPRAVIDAVNRGERGWPALRWIQVVHDVNGTICRLDDDGVELGWSEIRDGEEVRGGH